MPVVERTIEISGLSLAARIHGPDDGMPVLAMHGWLDNAASFDGLAPLLSGCRVVALDLAGHGLSQRRAGAPYHFIDYVADVAAVADALGWQKFSLLGHSLGAGVAALLAGTWPDRVHRLALLEGLGPLSDPDESAPERLRESLAAELAATRRTHERPGYPDPEVVGRRLAAATHMQPASAQTLLRRGLFEALPGRWDWRADSRLRLPSRLRLTESQVTAFLKQIACPTLLLRAIPGMAVSEDYFAARVACIADLRLVERPGGHHLHLDDPTPVAELVSSFLHGT